MTISLLSEWGGRGVFLLSEKARLFATSSPARDITDIIDIKMGGGGGYPFPKARGPDFLTEIRPSRGRVALWVDVAVMAVTGGVNRASGLKSCPDTFPAAKEVTRPGAGRFLRRWLGWAGPTRGRWSCARGKSRGMMTMVARAGCGGRGFGTAEQLGEERRRTCEIAPRAKQGLKPSIDFAGFTARVNSCPDTFPVAKASFSPSCEAVSFYKTAGLTRVDCDDRIRHDQVVS